VAIRTLIPLALASSGAESLCPSAQPHMADAMVFGVVGGTPERPRTGYLMSAAEVSDELLALAGPVEPTEVFRFAAPCARGGCQHFYGSSCRLAGKVVAMLPTVTEEAPPCRIRPRCQWWRQEGVAACRRCPQIVTQDYTASRVLRDAADPTYRKERGPRITPVVEGS
jgi:hypothetical protein